MAAATATLTVNYHPYGVDNTQRRQILYGTVTLSGGGTYTTNGIPLNWGALTTPDGKTFMPLIGPGTQPQVVYFYSTAGGQLNYGFDPVHGTLRIGSAGAELANAAAIAADTIAFEAEFLRGY